MITAVTINSVPVDLGQILAEEITVLHGRGVVDDGPTASSATLRLLVSAVQGMPTWAVGDPLTIATEAGELFTGVLSDRRISRHVDTLERGRVGVFELTATGPVATLGRRVVGDEPWPQEAASTRAARILDLSGVPYLVEPATPDLTMLPRDVDARTGLDLIGDLADDTGAAVFDLPDGTVVYQPLQARSRPQFYYRWQDFPAAASWAGFDPVTTWEGFDILSPASEQPIELPAGAVGWEPEWTSTAAQIVNSVRVGYGDDSEGDQATVSYEDQPSIDRMGKRYAYLGTQLATSGDADTRARHIISTQSRERWALGAVDVYADALTPTLQSALYGLRCGGWVIVPDLPQPAPATAFSAICEGWAYREWVDPTEKRHAAWTLALSDPVASLAVMTWADFTPAYMWSQFPPLLTWDAITDIASIGA